jgi:hypothetical protein
MQNPIPLDKFLNYLLAAQVSKGAAEQFAETTPIYLK